MIRLKTQKDIEGMKRSGAVLAKTLALIAESAKAGVSLHELDVYTQELLHRFQASPIFLGYTPEGSDKPYPASICTSVNEVIVHGIPSDRALKDGDILKIDLGVLYGGYITDSACTVGIGSIMPKARKLMEVTQRALSEAINVSVPGNRLGDIGWVIESIVKKAGFKVARGLTGHGVGFELHEDPTVYNYGQKKTGMKLAPGLVIAIEPMTSIGSEDIIQNKDDSYSTRDGSVSAHFEHTIAITENGCEILTKE